MSIPLQRQHERGFTLIELMVSMVMGLVLLAGISMMFVSNSRVAGAQSNRSERLNDLYLASQIMQTELRGSSGICWDGGNSQLIYRPLDSSVPLGGCSTVDSQNGSFRFSGGSICWDKPNDSNGCQELIRNLVSSPPGLQVSPSGNTNLSAVRKVVMTGQYTGYDQQKKTLNLAFDVWPRN